MALESFILDRGEEVKVVYPNVRVVAMPMIPPSRNGAMALTTTRLLWIQRSGKSFRVFLDFPLEKVKGITIDYGRLHKTVSIIDEQVKYTFSLRDIDKYGAECFRRIVYSMISERQDELRKEEEAAKASDVMDFPSLHKYMKAGGLVLRAFKCPSCGASIGFPEDGETVECDQCNATVNAEDIFEKIQSLI
jgi:hypothetical protein